MSTDPAAEAPEERSPEGRSPEGRSPEGRSPEGRPTYAEVAVPLPLPESLTYAVPEALGPLAPGVRVRVPVGSRRLVGMVVGARAEAPEGLELREVLEVLDRAPVIGPDLLELARFVSDYYLAPIGETVRILVPADLPAWGDRRVSLTDAGAIAPVHGPGEELLRDRLLERSRMRLAELQGELGVGELAGLVERLERQGRLRVDDPGRSSRFVTAVELVPGPLEELLRRCGRSPKGRAVVEYLRALERPATLGELTRAVGCGSSVVRRLVALGIVRRFTQPERLSLRRHRLGVEAGDEIVPRPDQAAAIGEIEAAIAARRFAPALLQGPTGAGKTEVYLRAVRRALDLGRSAILLVPEIALVPALAHLARERFGRRLAILHSNLSSSERLQEWERVRRGDARVVLGPRSALLAPVRDLGLVIVDEEHDASYKQDVVPRYNGRDLALVGARALGAAAVLVSATPSLESRWNAERGKLRRLRIGAREGSVRNEVVTVDLRQEKVARRPGEVHVSTALREAIAEALAEDGQVILLRNRRGYAPTYLCRACGEDFRCHDCGLAMTLHRRLGRLICHYCGEERPPPELCPACGEKALEPVGAGTERVEERFRELFPGVPVDVLDADASRRTGGAAAVLERFARGRTRVLVGTQMVAKGHDFPRVTLSAVLQADSYLGFPDFRAVERTYALLVQLAGRAGRGERPGKVVVQTYHPDHYAIRAALDGDDEAFAREEMRFRRVFRYPPYTRLVHLLARHKDPERARETIGAVARRLTAHPLAADVIVSGPAPAPFERLRGKYRHQLLVRGPSGARLRQLVRETAGEHPPSELVVDVDPYDLL